MNLPSSFVADQMNSKVERPDHASPIADIVAALSTIEDLNGLTEEEFIWLAIYGTERFAKDGEFIFSQGTPPEHLIFILSGEVMVHRHTSSPVSVLIGQTGRITGKTPFSRIKAWNADGRSSGATWFLELHDSRFPELLTPIQIARGPALSLAWRLLICPNVAGAENRRRWSTAIERKSCLLG